MPKWAFVDYKIKGKKEHLKDLKSILEKMSNEDDKSFTVKNDFGNCWLGNLVTSLGGDWNKVPCRGQLNDYYVSEDDDGNIRMLQLILEVAWSEDIELRDFIKSHYNNEIEIYYYQEEPGCEVYQTNSFEEFPTRYILELENIGQLESEDLSDVAENLSRYLDIEVEPDLDKIQEVLDDYQQDAEIYAGLHPIELSE